MNIVLEELDSSPVPSLIHSHICITRHLFNAIDNKYLLILCYECVGEYSCTTQA